MRGVVSIKIPKNPNLKLFSQNLRKNMTKEERKLWYNFLKQQDFVVKRQFIIDRYIVDFYCPKYKIVIEIDGNQHYEKEYVEKDKDRNNYLKKLGLQVLRYTNLEINESFDAVCQDILNQIGNN